MKMAEGKPASFDRHVPPEQRESLWLLIVGPVIWSLHFLLCYVTAAIWCAKAGRDASLGGARLAIAIYTALALGGIALSLWQAWRKMSFGSGRAPHDEDSAADRHRFLGFATLLLSGLSFVATFYVALSAVFIGSCA